MLNLQNPKYYYILQFSQKKKTIVKTKQLNKEQLSEK